MVGVAVRQDREDTSPKEGGQSVTCRGTRKFSKKYHAARDTSDMDELSLAIANIPNTIEAVLHKIVATYNRMDIDPGFFYALSAGVCLGLLALTYVSIYPGDPHSGWDITTDEDRFYAMKKEIEAETEEEEQVRLSKKNKNTNLSVEDELKEMQATTLRNRKNKHKHKKEEGAATALAKTTDIMADETNKNPVKTEEELEEESFMKSLEGLSDLEQEAKINVRNLKREFGGVENLRKVVKGKVYSDSKRKSGCVYWSLRVINWMIPLSLICAACYSLNQDYDINVLNYVAWVFPREAAVLKSFTGERQDFGQQYK